jgi:hypothetical protein
MARRAMASEMVEVQARTVVQAETVAQARIVVQAERAVTRMIHLVEVLQRVPFSKNGWPAAVPRCLNEGFGALP